MASFMQKKSSSPHMADGGFDSTSIVRDLGVLPRGTVIRTIVAIQNTQTTPLSVAVESTSCGCMKARLTPQLVAPGQIADLEAVLDVGGRTGDAVIEVSVSSDPDGEAQPPQRIRVQFKVHVDESRGFVPGGLLLPLTWRGEQNEALIRLALSEQDEFVFVSSSFANGCSWLMFEPLGERPLQGAVRVASAQAPAGTGAYFTDLLVEGRLNGHDIQFKVPVRGEIRDIVYLEPPVVFWSRESRHERRIVRVLSRQGGPVHIIELQSTLNAASRLSWSLSNNASEAVLSTNASGAIREQLVVRARDGSGQEYALPLKVVAP